MSSKGDGWIQKKVRTYPSGRKTTSFIARIKPPGQDELSKSFTKHGRVDEPGTAAHWLSQQQEEIRKRRWVDPRDRQWTVAEWGKEWVASLTGIDEESRRMYKRVLDLDIIPSGLGDEPIHTVDQLRMGRWMNELAERKWTRSQKHPDGVKLAPSTLAGRRTVVAMLFGAAVDAGIIRGTSPMRKVRAPVTDPLAVEPLDPDEIPTPEQVWQLHAVAAKHRPLFAEQIIVTAGTGQRPGELLGLQGKNRRAKELHIVRQRKLKESGTVYGLTKTRRMRRIPIGQEVDDSLDRHLELTEPLYKVGPEDCIFRWRDGTGWRRSTWASQWQAIRTEAGLPDLKFYLLRHFYASMLIAGGASPRLVMDRMGHTSSRYTLERYARLWHDDDEVTRALTDAGLKRDRDGTVVPDPNAKVTPPEAEIDDGDDEEL